MRCSSYCTGTAYDINSIYDIWRPKAEKSQLYSEVAFISFNNKQTICLFAYGSIVFWGYSLEEEKTIIDKIEQFVSGPLTNIQEDAFTYSYGDETHIEEEEDRIILGSKDPLLKLSISYGLSQSVKLSNFEYEIDQTIQRTRHLPAELAEKGKISLSRKKISQHIGQLFSQKNSINLDSYALDTPEFFWKRPRYEPFYQQTVDFLDIEVRLSILNGKLNLIHELYQILNDELKHAHSSFLEWVIILLILVEVIILVVNEIR